LNWKKLEKKEAYLFTESVRMEKRIGIRKRRARERWERTKREKWPGIYDSGISLTKTFKR